jgi:two-component system, OmpR family, response regulator RegX3
MGLIAIVDDDNIHCELLSMALTDMGHLPRSFADGASFLRAAAGEAFDLVMLDWSLPDMPGSQVLRDLHGLGRTPPKVIVLSGRSEASVLEEALTSGASVFILKPARIAQIAREAGKLLVA